LTGSGRLRDLDGHTQRYHAVDVLSAFGLVDPPSPPAVAVDRGRNMPV